MAASDASSDDGIAVADLAMKPGYWNKETAVYYWQAMRLDADHIQTDASGDDETANGTTLTHVRYHADAWQYKTADGKWHYFESDDQFVVYYLQKTQVTDEIITYMKDWGFDTSKTTSDWSGGYGQVALSVAVVYPNGTLSPDESSIYSKSTTIYNFKLEVGNTWVNRDLGIIAPVNNSDYNISKITITNGSRHSNLTSNVWYTNDSIDWEKATTESGGEWYDETEVWNKSSGTTPVVNGKTLTDFAWTAKNQGRLILIYLEPVEKETNLNVVYYDDNAKKEITSYQISMTYKDGDEVPTYTTALKNGNGFTIGENKDWPGKTSLDAGYLPDDAYVTNSVPKNETFEKALEKVSGATGIYKSGIYEYIRAEISEDGKTLTLHYNLKNTGGKTYVVDFGLPIDIPFSDYNITNDVSEVSFAANDKTLVEKQGEYGYGKIDITKKIVTYTLTETIDNKVAIPIFLFNGNNAIQCTVYVVPATNVYYEDSFAKVNDGKGVASTAIWERTTNDTSARQALSELGKAPDSVYGYDSAYANNTQYSMNGYSKVTVTSAMASDTWDANNDAWPTASFTFKGTGFDVISLTNNTSGAILVDVYDSNGNKVKGYFVDNYLGYGFVGGEWKVMATDDNILYQIPVMKVCDLPYDSYNVTITVFYNDAFEHNGDQSYDFWLDAIRVYDPMGKNADYTTDKEGYPQYINLRDQIAASGSNVGIKNTLFIDGSAEAEVADYINLGPNNEVYLAKGQAISFKLPANDNIEKVQIGAKAPNGATELNVNSTNVVADGLKSATEMYYDITSQASGRLVTITNTTGNILSLTNIKITFKQQQNEPVSLETLSNDDAEAAVATVRALFAAPVDPEPTEPEQPEEPEKTFEPERFETSWSSNVRNGGRAVLTVKASTDVDAIIVDGVTYTKYFTRTERVGRGWNAQRVTYREFVYMMTVNESGTLTVPVVAVSNEQGESSPYETTLTVKPSSPIRDWIGGLFGRWF